MNGFRIAGASMSDENEREARVNLIEFFSILTEWDSKTTRTEHPDTSTPPSEPNRRSRAR